ncbi:ABC transporter permease [Candidatus Poribacteria bacterium]|nr:ABC transporter permease [Candidatus Poribacteria bacterium]
MKLTQGFLLGFAALGQNKLRSLLTTLGIGIGIAAVIGMVSGGGGAQWLMLSEFERIGGANLIVVYRPDEIEKAGKGVKNRSTAFLRYEDEAELLANCPSIGKISSEISGFDLPASRGARHRTITIASGTPGYEEAHNWFVEKGRFMQDGDINMNARVCVIGSEVQKQLFGRTDPIGQELKVANARFTVVGVMETKGNIMATQGWDNTVIIPLTTMQTRFVGQKIIGNFYIQAKNFERIDPAEAEIKLMLKRLHPDGVFEVFTSKKIIEQVSNVSRILQVLLGGIAAIALFVGGIGLMNIMLVSVTERTREIGLRKAVGAKRRDILTQFMVEAMALSLTGGLIGVLIGMGIGNGGSWFISNVLIKDANWPAVVSQWAIIVALMVSTGVGVIFGSYPALRAADLTPTEALHFQ